METTKKKNTVGIMSAVMEEFKKRQINETANKSKTKKKKSKQKQGTDPEFEYGVGDDLYGYSFAHFYRS